MVLFYQEIILQHNEKIYSQNYCLDFLNFNFKYKNYKLLEFF